MYLPFQAQRLLWGEFLWPQDSYVDILMPKGDGLVGGAFGKCLNNMDGTFMNKISTLRKRLQEAP